MKFITVVIGIVAVIGISSAAPIDDSKNAHIVRYDNDNIGIDGYKFA